MAVVPPPVPLTVGGGTVALIVATTGQFNHVLDLFMMSLVCVLIALAMAAICFFAGPISAALGPIGMRIYEAYRRYRVDGDLRSAPGDRQSALLPALAYS